MFKPGRLQGCLERDLRSDLVQTDKTRVVAAGHVCKYQSFLKLNPPKFLDMITLGRQHGTRLDLIQTVGREQIALHLLLPPVQTVLVVTDCSPPETSCSPQTVSWMAIIMPISS